MIEKLIEEAEDRLREAKIARDSNFNSWSRKDGEIAILEEIIDRLRDDSPIEFSATDKHRPDIIIPNPGRWSGSYLIS